LKYHVLSWSLWALAAVLPALMTRNPLYLVIVLLAVSLSYVQRERRDGAPWRVFLRAGLFFWALTIPFNALFVHAGDRVIFSLPQQWPLIGGPITVEAVVYGLVSGLALFTVLLVFTTYNAQVSHHELLRYTPGFLYQAGLVTSISITFVPQMLSSAQEIREAQAVRGHRFRKLRDMLPLFVPLLTTGLERAVQLAESMESRGFGGNLAPISWRQELVRRLATVLGLISLSAGLFLSAYFREESGFGWALAVTGAVMLLLVFGAQGSRVQRSRYGRPRWDGADTLVAIASGVVIAVFAGIKGLAPMELVYYPYPPFSLTPGFNPLLGGVLLLLALPAIVREAVSVRTSASPPGPGVTRVAGAER